MKKFLFIALVLAACNKSNDAPTPTYTYSQFVDSFNIQYNKPYQVENVANDTVWFLPADSLIERQWSDTTLRQSRIKIGFTWPDKSYSINIFRIGAPDYSAAPLSTTLGETTRISSFEYGKIKMTVHGVTWTVKPAF